MFYMFSSSSQPLDMIASVGGNRRAPLRAYRAVAARRSDAPSRRVRAVMGNRIIPSKRKQYKSSRWVSRVNAQNQNKLWWYLQLNRHIDSLMVATSSGNFPSNHGPAHRNPFIMSFIALYEEIKHSDLQKIRATRRRKMELKHSCLQLSTLWLYSEYPGNYSHNTSKIYTSTRLVQEINNEDHNCC